MPGGILELLHCLAILRFYAFTEKSLQKLINLVVGNVASIQISSVLGIEEIHFECAVVMAQEGEKAKQLSYGWLEQMGEKLSMKVESTQYFRPRDLELCNKRAFHKKAVEEKNNN
ncbi:hypothetical protein ME1_00550 [Bartonella vinsonii subsp. arupensis OK-94-513]|uniref:Uncharacterized protein n=2 Tax=Bartonella vinsonii subsp. arupensis TaxID=110578 RepID=J1JVI0_BARVI|nr:hypothetical protein [Bartonella vinsonii]EJF88550.1 hypothetical protein ME1_00550 [Bartonella vinsonii subsp. arupensis OK-94-513]EJF98076.1 hypothetical protein MEI_00936 [Bartonella vinsonii subsp. arupensis Pm136co]